VRQGKRVFKALSRQGKRVSPTAGVSGLSVRFNRQLHPDEKSAIAKQANGNQAEQDKLTKAKCLAVKCWAEYPVGSDAYNANYVSQLEASQLGPEIEWVNRQQEAGLFNYTPGQKITDMAKSDPLGVAKDTTKVVVGAVTAKTGLGPCTGELLIMYAIYFMIAYVLDKGRSEFFAGLPLFFTVIACLISKPEAPHVAVKYALRPRIGIVFLVNFLFGAATAPSQDYAGLVPGLGMMLILGSVSECVRRSREKKKSSD
jgi:hypothetical protein